MGWKGVTVMDQRIRFISEYLTNYFSLKELCQQFEISRKTGYKWIGRYKTLGILIGIERVVSGGKSVKWCDREVESEP